jgi:uracil-DNA glycosylase family 4
MKKPESPPTRPRWIEALRKATDACRECPLRANATQSVMGDGPVHAVLMVVGEQPGDKEDLAGRPFVGPAGRLFDRAIAELGWHRKRPYIHSDA